MKFLLHLHAFSSNILPQRKHFGFQWHSCTQRVRVLLTVASVRVYVRQPTRNCRKNCCTQRGSTHDTFFFTVVQFFDAALAVFDAKSSLLSRNCKLPTCWKFPAKPLQFFFRILVHTLPKFVDSCHYIFLSSCPILILSNYFYSQFLLNNFF